VITVDKLEIDPAQTGFDFLAGKRIKIERERARLFSAFGFERYTIVNVEEHTAKNGHKYQVIQSRYLGAAGQEVQMYERQYAFGATLFRVAYTEESPALNDLEKVKQALDNVQPIVPKGWREPAAAETGSGAVATENPKGFTENAAEKFSLANRNPKYCEDVPEKDRYTSDNDRSFVGKMWQVVGGGAACVLDQVKALLVDLPKAIHQFAFDDETRDQVLAAAGTLMSELAKHPIDTGKMIFNSLSESAGKSLPKFWCLNLQKKVEFLCNTGVTVAMVGSLLLKVPMVASAQAGLAKAFNSTLNAGKTAGKWAAETGGAAVGKGIDAGKWAGGKVVDGGKWAGGKVADGTQYVAGKAGEAVNGAAQGVGNAMIKGGAKLTGNTVKLEKVPGKAAAGAGVGAAESSTMPLSASQAAAGRSEVVGFFKSRGKIFPEAKLEALIAESDEATKVALMKNLKAIMDSKDPAKTEKLLKTLNDLKIEKDGVTIARADFEAVGKNIHQIAHGKEGPVPVKTARDPSERVAQAAARPDEVAAAGSAPGAAGLAEWNTVTRSVQRELETGLAGTANKEQLLQNYKKVMDSGLSQKAKDQLAVRLSGVANDPAKVEKLLDSNLKYVNKKGLAAAEAPPSSPATIPPTATTASTTTSSAADMSVLKGATESTTAKATAAKPVNLAEEAAAVRTRLPSNGAQSQLDQFMNDARMAKMNDKQQARLMAEMKKATELGRTEKLEQILSQYHAPGTTTARGNFQQIQKAILKMNPSPNFLTRSGRTFLGKDPLTGYNPRFQRGSGAVFGSGSASEIDNGLRRLAEVAGREGKVGKELETTWKTLTPEAQTVGRELAKKDPDKFLMVLDGYSQAKSGKPSDFITAAKVTEANLAPGASTASSVAAGTDATTAPALRQSGFQMATGALGTAGQQMVDPRGLGAPLQAVRAAAVPAAIHAANQEREQQQKEMGIFPSDDDSPQAQAARLVRDSEGRTVSRAEMARITESQMIGTADRSVATPEDLEAKLKALSEVENGNYKNLLDQYHRMLKKHGKDYPEKLVTRVQSGELRKVIEQIQREGKVQQAAKAQRRGSAGAHRQPSNHHRDKPKPKPKTKPKPKKPRHSQQPSESSSDNSSGDSGPGDFWFGDGG